MTTWNLKNHGDRFERRYWPHFSPLFPNYEVFWSEFVTPMTCRNDFPADHPLWIHFRQDVSSDLQNIAMAHYTIFRCLAANWDIQQIDPPFKIQYEALHQERFDMFYTNLGTVTDMVANLFFFTAKIQVTFGQRKKIIERKSAKELEKILQDFIDREYESRLKDFERNQRPVIIAAHDRPDFLTEILGRTKEVKDYLNFSEQVLKHIRNVAIHNPVVGSMGEKVPKPIQIKRYELWGDLFYKRNDADFVDREEQFAEHSVQIQRLLNALWGQFIPLYRGLSQLKGYGAMLGYPPKGESIVAQQDKHQSSTSARPTSSSASRPSTSSQWFC